MDGRSIGDGATLRTLLPDAEIIGDDGATAVAHCTTDPRQCRTGDLFVALVDAAGDGHAAIDEAVRLGAAAVVASRPVQVSVPVCYVADTQAAYGAVCQALAGRPSEKLKMIGVVGALGKTTAGYLIASVLSAAQHTPGVLGSLGYCDGAETADARWTTPPPRVMAAWLARMVENGCTHAVVEASPRGVLCGNTAGVRFDACCVTNLLMRSSFGGTAAEDARRAVMRLLEQLPPEGLLIANADDASSVALIDRHDGPAMTVGIDAPAELTATIVERHRSEQTFLLSFGDEVVPVRTHLLGDHNVRHCLTAAAVGAGYGIDPATIVRGIESVVELPGRLERIECGQPFGVFLDDAATPVALEACLRSLRTVTSRRLLCVYDSGCGDGVQQRAEWVGVVDRWCDESFVAAIERRGVPKAFGSTPDRFEAIAAALRCAATGDCVLIAGRADETYSLVDREQDYWSDRQLVRQTLYQLMNEDQSRSKAA